MKSTQQYLSTRTESTTDLKQFIAWLITRLTGILSLIMRVHTNKSYILSSTSAAWQKFLLLTLETPSMEVPVAKEGEWLLSTSISIKVNLIFTSEAEKIFESWLETSTLAHGKSLQAARLKTPSPTGPTGWYPWSSPEDQPQCPANM